MACQEHEGTAVSVRYVTVQQLKSLAVGRVPSDLKKAVVRPHLKKAGSDTSQMKNYIQTYFEPVISFQARAVHNLHIRREPLDGGEQTRAECRQDRTSLGWFQIVLLVLMTADRHYGWVTRPSQPVITCASSVSPSHLTSAPTSTFQIQVHRAFTGFVRFEEIAVRLTLRLQTHCLISYQLLQHRAGGVIESHH